MKISLQIIGVLLILTGAIFGVSQIGELSDLKDDVEYWEDAADRNWDNHLIEARFNEIRDNYIMSITIVITAVVTGVLSGVFFMALASIIELLQKLVSNKTVHIKEHQQETQEIL